MAEVHINQVDTIMRAVDGEALLAPAMLETITQHVLAALEQRQARQMRAAAERRVTGGVRAEMEGTCGHSV
jgi:hypothetical protein